MKTIEDDIFLQSIFYNLADPRQKDCVLILDEVYIKATLQYHVWKNLIPNPLFYTISELKLNFKILIIYSSKVQIEGNID